MEERDRRKKNRNEREETEEIKNIPLSPYLQALPNCKPISVGHPGDVSYTIPLPHLTNPDKAKQKVEVDKKLHVTLNKGRLHLSRKVKALCKSICIKENENTKQVNKY